MAERKPRAKPVVKKPAAKPAAKKVAAAKAVVAKKPAAAAKGPTTRSGTLNAVTAGAVFVDVSAVESVPTVEPGPAEAVAPLSSPAVLADPALGPGFVEHGVGLGRHRVEDGPVAAEGTVVLVAPERGEQ